jgi:peroxiredoxin
VDTPEQSKKLADDRGYAFPILSDAERRVIREYDLVHPGGGPGGADIARPAEFLLDANGIIRWVNLTESYRIRPKPEDILAVIDRLPLGSLQPPPH